MWSLLSQLARFSVSFSACLDEEFVSSVPAHSYRSFDRACEIKRRILHSDASLSSSASFLQCCSIPISYQPAYNLHRRISNYCSIQHLRYDTTASILGTKLAFIITIYSALRLRLPRKKNVILIVQSIQ